MEVIDIKGNKPEFNLSIFTAPMPKDTVSGAIGNAIVHDISTEDYSPLTPTKALYARPSHWTKKLKPCTTWPSKLQIKDSQGQFKIEVVESLINVAKGDLDREFYAVQASMVFLNIDITDANDNLFHL